jgi:type II secretory pathway pseudopilin PulG
MVTRLAARGVHTSAGFTYLSILFVVAIMGVGLALVGTMWHTAALREREAELLHAGHEYRKAIEHYYLSGPGQYPRTLADLLKDPRQPGTVRHLRKLYPDPITGKDEWGLVNAPDGGIAGVYSISEDKPLKSGGFAVRDGEFESKTRYSDWQFIYSPPQVPDATPPLEPPARTSSR